MTKFSLKKLLLLLMVCASFSLSALNHSAFTNLLKQHVTEKGMVDYVGFKKDKAKLDEYISSLQANPPQASWSKNESMAYWINAYNAFTIRLIIENYPVKSIMKINAGKPWDLAFIEIDNKKYTLNGIENDILRKEYNDARIHFAINCASISCPKLATQAYEAATLDKQLNESTKIFINNPSKNNLSPSVIAVSKIFDWFKDDFKSYGGIIPFINKYSNTKINSNAGVTFKDYNWNLNS